MNVRDHDWYDTEAQKSLYGLQVHIPSVGWCFVARAGAPLLFATEAERTAERQRMAALPEPATLAGVVRKAVVTDAGGQPA
ncbi:MAG: hypothetical protein PW843_24300 [Azospirillaceae bacterium]|nr:hypothetical protein [Azospirillaceae bacterium]